MAVCGFSDSDGSSDDESDQDIDIQTNQNVISNSKTSLTKPNIKQNNANMNANNHNKEEDEDDDWVTAKAKPIEETAAERRAKKARTQKARHGFNNYMAPTSLKEMRNQIHSNKSKDNNNNNGPAPPPPLVGMNDNRNFKKVNGKYKVDRKRRKNLDEPEPLPPSKHPWKNKPIVTGVSAQTTCGIKMKDGSFKAASIKLSEVIHLLRNVEYKPEEFVAIRMKLKNPSMTVTIFSNGKLTTQGGKAQKSCVYALRKVARMLQGLELYKDAISDITEPTFYGVQANAHLGSMVDLQAMSEAFPKKVEYSPDIESSYLKFRDPLKYGDKGSCHVYHGGRVTILGCHDVKKCILWIEKMYEHCKPHFIKEEDMQIDENQVSISEFSNMFGTNHNNNAQEHAPMNTDNDEFGLGPPPVPAPVEFDIAPPPLL